MCTQNYFIETDSFSEFTRYSIMWLYYLWLFFTDFIVFCALGPLPPDYSSLFNTSRPKVLHYKNIVSFRPMPTLKLGQE